MPQPIYVPSKMLFYADAVYDRIHRLVKDRTESLKEDESVMTEVILPDGHRIVATGFGYQNPNFLIVYGLDPKRGLEVEAWLSHTNVQIIVSVWPKGANEPRREIGFKGGLATTLPDTEGQPK
ncbi:MAG TPA: hypothetical protein VI756_12640 [Blastocatellia bacterium]